MPDPVATPGACRPAGSRAQCVGYHGEVGKLLATLREKINAWRRSDARRRRKATRRLEKKARGR